MSSSDSPTSVPLPTPIHRHSFSKAKKLFLMSIVIYLGIANAFGALGATILLGPEIQDSLGITTDELQWLTTSFYITVGSLSLISGRLADLIGGKRICLVGMAIFTLASLGSCFVTTKEGLFATRGLSGLGSALAVVAGYPIIMMVTTEGNERTLALAFYIAAWPTGVGLGTLAAGFIAYDDWQRFFYLLTGVTALSFFTILIFVPDDHPDRLVWRNQIDWLGNTFFAISLFLMLYVLSVAPGTDDGWATPYIIVLLILSIAFIVAFAFWEIRVEKKNKTPPLASMGIFTLDKGRLSLLFLFGIFNFAGFAGFMFFTTLYFQEYLKLSLRDTAIHFIPGPIAGIICNITVGFIAPYVPSQYILSFGSFAAALSLILFAIMPVGASYWGYTFFAMICSVLGGDCAGSAGIIYVTQVITGSRSGMGTGLWQTVMQLGLCLGPSIGTLVLRYTAHSDARRKYNSTLAYDVDEFPRESYLHGLRMGAWTIAALCLVAGVICPIALRGMGNSKRQTATSSDSIESQGMTDEESQKEIKDGGLVVGTLSKESEKVEDVGGCTSK